MTASFHVAAGAAAGVVVQECLFPDAGSAGKIFWAFAAGVASHILLDILPHQEYALKGLSLWAVVLAEVGLVLVLVLPSARSPAAGLVLFSAMVGGTLPDFLEMAYEYFFRRAWLTELGGFLHLHSHGIVPLQFEINFWWQSFLAALLVLFVRLRSV